jgi:Helix-turn-helix domain
MAGRNADPDMRGRATPAGVGVGGYLAGVSRFRLLPAPAQQVALLEHCRHARFVWNLAVEQQQFWQPGRRAPGYNEQSAQLTEIRAEHDWLAAGTQTVQQQALRDFAQAMRNFFAGTHRRPTWRKAGVHEGFRQIGLKPRHVEKLNGRYIDHGVAVSAALSTGELLHTPSLTPGERTRLRRCNTWHEPTAAPTADSAPSWRSPDSKPAKPIGNAAGWKRPRPTWRAGSTPFESKTST